MENEKMITAGKEQCIVDLYTIRAGLSLISENTKKISSHQYNINYFNSCVSQARRNIDKEVKEVSEAREGYNYSLTHLEHVKRMDKMREKQVSNERNAEEKQRQKNENIVCEYEGVKEQARIVYPYTDFVEKRFFFINLIVFSIITAIVFMVSGLSTLIFKENLALAILFSIVVSPVGGAILAALLHYATPILYIYPLVRMIKKRKKYIQIVFKKRLSKLDKAEKEVKPINEESLDVVNAKKKIVEAKRALEDAENRLQACSEDYEKQYKNFLNTCSQAEAAINTLKQTNNLLQEFLYRNYNHKLDESDWEHIDLLLYYLQTNRADSIKECLQLMDRQKQTNEIVGAIGQATKTINNTIHTSMQNMSRALAQSFSVISNQLTEISQNQRANIAATEKLTNAIGGISTKISDKVSAQIEATELTNALLAKANINSKDLIYELRHNQHLWKK